MKIMMLRWNNVSGDIDAGDIGGVCEGQLLHEIEEDEVWID